MVVHSICPKAHPNAAKLDGFVCVSEIPLLQHVVVARPKVQQVIEGKECHLVVRTNIKHKTRDVE